MLENLTILKYEKEQAKKALYERKLSEAASDLSSEIDEFRDEVRAMAANAGVDFDDLMELVKEEL